MTARRQLLLAMMAAIALIATALLLDEQREFEAAIDNLKDEQIALATAVAADFETRLKRLEAAGTIRPEATEVAHMIPQLLGGAMQLEQQGSRILLVARPAQQKLLTTDGRSIDSAMLQSALRTGAAGITISREEAPRFGLPPRIAIAGIDTIASSSGSWGVIVLVSGERLRARERYAQSRVLLGLGLVSAIILGFGGMAIRQERRQVAAARALEVAALERERERLLAKADKMATLAALSSGIAHEVATPLGTIMARVEQLSPIAENDPEARSSLQVVMEQVERIQSIIRGVLGLARGELPPFVSARPEHLARAAVGLCLHRLGQAGVEIKLDLVPNLPSIACDPPMLEQALTNMLLNASDASPRGATVHFRTRADGANVAFVVDDEGEGIDPETAAHAHEPFFTTKSGPRGNGLGLAITREVVSHHGGSLRLEPRDDVRGTRATIELPAASAETAAE